LFGIDLATVTDIRRDGGKMKKVIILLALMGIALLLYGISKTDAFQKTIEVDKNTKLTIKNKNGSVKITGWDKDYVDFTATKKTNKGVEELDKVDIVIIQDENLSIETEYLTKNPKVSVSYELSVPRSLLLKNIKSSNGSINIENAGTIDIVRTSNGSINIEECEGSMSINTSNGSITAINIEGSVDAHTSNGKIRLENINGLASAKTSNGSIQVFNVEYINSIKTSNGSIQAHIKQLTDDVSINSSNGSITVYLDDDLDAELNASTSNGKIKLHDYSIQANNISGSSVAGILGKGGNLLKLRTSNASIHIYDGDKVEF
jgi:DUF4097 and DUF4098 domain-containing protein YvlB